jgi:hypothetical protein
MIGVLTDDFKTMSSQVTGVDQFDLAVEQGGDLMVNIRQDDKGVVFRELTRFMASAKGDSDCCIIIEQLDTKSDDIRVKLKFSNLNCKLTYQKLRYAVLDAHQLNLMIAYKSWELVN